MRLDDSNKLTAVVNGCLVVDGRPFVVEFPDEHLSRIEDGRLVTVFRGHLDNYWDNDEIDGYWD